MKLNRTNKKITSLIFSILMITLVFVGFMMPVTGTESLSNNFMQNVTLAEGGIIIGTVTCWQGLAVAGVSVSVGVCPTRGITGATTDATGFYTITGLATGTYELWVSPPLDSPLAPAFITNITVVAGKTTIQNVTLADLGIISGRVTCWQGYAVVGAYVSVRNPATGISDWSITDTTGFYTILATGTYDMVVHPPHGVLFLVPAIVPEIVVTAGEITTQDVVLQQGGHVSGRVTDFAGAPVANVDIRFFGPDTGACEGWAWTDGYGNYVSTGLSPGTYNMVVSLPGGVSLPLATILGIVVTAGETTIQNVTLAEELVIPPLIPGFGALLVIAGLLSVAYLVLISRKKK